MKIRASGPEFSFKFRRISEIPAKIFKTPAKIFKTPAKIFKTPAKTLTEAEDGGGSAYP